jgi:pimeloyl-ACP methyl ester carboxylesterase
VPTRKAETLTDCVTAARGPLESSGCPIGAAIPAGSGPRVARMSVSAHRVTSAASIASRRYDAGMRTERVRVADGVELVLDLWSPGPPAEAPEHLGPAPAGARPDDPSFVLVHGLASNARMWDGVATRLSAAGHPAITVDQRGHGRSSKPDGPYDVTTVAEDLHAVIGALGLERPVLAGQSWGGNVVLELAARHPAATRGIVCVDGGWLEPSRSFPDWESCRAALAPPRLAGRPLAEVEAYVRAAHPDWPESGIGGTLANFEVRPDRTVAPWLTYERHLSVLRGLWEHHPSARYRDLSVPVLLVPATNDDAAWMERKRPDVAAAEADIPRARVCWMDGDHDLHAQHPAELADLMLAAVSDGFFA